MSRQKDQSLLRNAWRVWEAETGCRRDDEGMASSDCRLLAEDSQIGCSVDAEGVPCEHGSGETQRLTTIEWARKLGRGFAFSENY